MEIHCNDYLSVYTSYYMMIGLAIFPCSYLVSFCSHHKLFGGWAARQKSVDGTHSHQLVFKITNFYFYTHTTRICRLAVIDIKSLNWIYSLVERLDSEYFLCITSDGKQWAHRRRRKAGDDKSDLRRWLGCF